MSDDISKDAINSWDPSNSIKANNSINADNSRYTIATAGTPTTGGSPITVETPGTEGFSTAARTLLPAVIPSTSRTSKTSSDVDYSSVVVKQRGLQQQKTYQEHQKQATAADLARARVSSTTGTHML